MPLIESFTLREYLAGIGGYGRAILGSRGKFNQRTPSGTVLAGQKYSLENTADWNLLKVAMNHSHLNNILSKGADIFSLAKIKHVKADGTEIENSEVVKFLQNPNPLQSLKSYLYQYYIYYGVFSRTFQYKIKRTSYKKLPAAMWQLLPSEMKINLTGKLVHRQTKIEDIIESYELKNDPNKFETAQVIFMWEGIGDLLNPTSKVEALQIPLSNLQAGGKKLNQIWANGGAIGMITPEPSSNGDSPIPMAPEENAEVRKKYKDEFNNDSENSPVMFPGFPMKWTPMTQSVAELQLSELGEEAFGQLLDAYNLERDLFSSQKGATFENKSEAQKLSIQNAFQPLIDRLCEQLTASMIETEGEKLIGCYDYLPCMQVDKKTEAEAKLTLIKGLSTALRDGVIAPQQYADKAELDMDGTGELAQQASSNPNNNN